VHCAYGISRSSTLVVAFLMKKLKIKFYDAFSYVKKKRPISRPNLGFQKELLNWEEKLAESHK